MEWTTTTKIFHHPSGFWRHFQMNFERRTSIDETRRHDWVRSRDILRFDSSGNASAVVQLRLSFALFDQVFDVDQHRILLHVQLISFLQQRHQFLVVGFHAGEKIVDEYLKGGGKQCTMVENEKKPDKIAIQ